MVAHQRSLAPVVPAMAPFRPWICTRKVKLVSVPFFTKLMAMPSAVGVQSGGPSAVVSAALATQLAELGSLTLKPSSATLALFASLPTVPLTQYGSAAAFAVKSAGVMVVVPAVPLPVQL